MDATARGAALVASAVLAMIGYGQLPVTTATAFSYTTPLLVTVLAATLLRERIPFQRWVAVGIGFAGVLVIVHPASGGASGAGHLIGVGAALGSAILYAIQQMIIRHSRDTMTTADVVAQAAIVGLVLLGGAMPFVWRSVPLSAMLLILAATAAQTAGLVDDCGRDPPGPDFPAGAVAIWRNDLGDGPRPRHVRPCAGRGCAVRRGADRDGRLVVADKAIVPAEANGGKTMKSIFVQIKCDLGRAYAVAAQLADEFENASQIYSTSGHYDLLVQFRLAGWAGSGLFINETLHKVPGIKDTYTIMVFDAFTPGAGSSP